MILLRRILATDDKFTPIYIRASSIISVTAYLDSRGEEVGSIIKYADVQEWVFESVDQILEKIKADRRWRY